MTELQLDLVAPGTRYASAPLAVLPGWPWPGLQPRAYRCILADPPWAFRLYSDSGEAKSPQHHYACMDLAAIAALPVAQLAHPVGGALVMWATAPMLPQALTVMQAWGFHYVSAGPWAKRSSRDAGWAFGTGYWFRSATEFFLLGTRGKISPLNRSTRNLIVAPVREHSRKPNEFRAMVEGLVPGPRAELFAREAAPGWDAWGNETDKFTPSTESEA